MPESIRPVPNLQPELPGARSAPSSTFLAAVQRTRIGSRHLKLWFVFLATYCKVLSGNPTGSCRVSLARLAHDSEGSERRVRADNAALAAAGWLTIERTGRSAVYRLRTVDAVIAAVPSGRKRPVRPATSGHSDRPHVATRKNRTVNRSDNSGWAAAGAVARGAAPGRESETEARARLEGQRLALLRGEQ